MDSMRAHITDSVKEAVRKTNSLLAVIPGGTTKYLQPLDISVNRAFKVALRTEWEAWMTSGDKSFTKTGRMRRATFAQVCQWVLIAWGKVKKSTIVNGFEKAGLLCAVADDSASDGTASTSTLPQAESDSGSEADVSATMAEETLLQLFVSDTESSDFSGFSEQDDDDTK